MFGCPWVVLSTTKSFCLFAHLIFCIFMEYHEIWDQRFLILLILANILALRYIHTFTPYQVSLIYFFYIQTKISQIFMVINYMNIIIIILFSTNIILCRQSNHSSLPVSRCIIIYIFSLGAVHISRDTKWAYPRPPPYISYAWRQR